MLGKLQQRWKVNCVNLILVIFTFALGGEVYVVMQQEKDWYLPTKEEGIFLVVAYLILITLLWPLCVLIISMSLEKFSFFKK